MIGENVVYVTDRGEARLGGTYHQPVFIAGERAFITGCDLRLQHPTLMQRDWAETTEATPCPKCFPEDADDEDG